ncbi:MAG: YCF48-related protein [Candidatus Micrarchaeota archaeon]
MNFKLLTAVFLLFSLLINAQWVSQNSSTNFSLLDVDFVDQKIGYVVGGPYLGFQGFPEGVLLKTSDAGETWMKLDSPVDVQLQGVCFVNSEVGWVVGEEQIYKTINSGESWIEQSNNVSLIGNTSLFSQAIDCIDENTAYIVGFNSVIVKTTNGQSWNQVYGDWNGSNPSLFGIKCVSASQCWAVGEAGTVLATLNGGTTWSEQEAYSDTGFYTVFFLDSEKGWVAGDNARIRRTTNGLTWMNQTIDNIYSTFRATYFANSTYGWVAGGDAILFTNDSGYNWHSINLSSLYSSNLPVIFRGIDFPSSTVGWVVGDNGTILKYVAPILASTTSEPEAPNGGIDLQCPILTDDCEAGFTPQWIYDQAEICIVDYTCVEATPANAPLSQSPVYNFLANLLVWLQSLFKFGG